MPRAAGYTCLLAAVATVAGSAEIDWGEALAGESPPRGLGSVAPDGTEPCGRFRPTVRPGAMSAAAGPAPSQHLPAVRVCDQRWPRSLLTCPESALRRLLPLDSR